MFIAEVCSLYGWTYQEYQDQPAFFIELIREKMIRDNKQKEMEIKKLNRGR